MSIENRRRNQGAGDRIVHSSKARQITFVRGGFMSAFERLLMPGCTELPECRCGKEMLIASVERLPERSDAGVRVYKCPACRHEMRLTIWTIDAAA